MPTPVYGPYLDMNTPTEPIGYLRNRLCFSGVTLVSRGSDLVVDEISSQAPAGIAKGDRLVSINGQPLTKSHHVDDAVTAVLSVIQQGREAGFEFVSSQVGHQQCRPSSPLAEPSPTASLCHRCGGACRHCAASRPMRHLRYRPRPVRRGA